MKECGPCSRDRKPARTRVGCSTDEEAIGLLSTFTLEDQHTRVRKALKLHGCVIHSFRHTFGARLGEAGATIMKAVGHSSVSVSQKYVHPTPEAMERAFEAGASNELEGPCKPAGKPKATTTATISTTVSESEPELVAQVL